MIKAILSYKNFNVGDIVNLIDHPYAYELSGITRTTYKKLISQNPYTINKILGHYSVSFILDFKWSVPIVLIEHESLNLLEDGLFKI